MLSGIRKLMSCNIQTEAVPEHIQLRNKIIDKLQPIALEVTICDRPTLNQNGLTQYSYDENHESILKRRVHIARQLGEHTQVCDPSGGMRPTPPQGEI